MNLKNLVSKGQLGRALDLLSRMEPQGSVPSVDMYKSLLNACIKRKALAEAKQIQAHLARHGLEFAGTLGEHVVSTLVRCNGLESALRVFQRLPEKTVLSWTAVISGYTMSRQGKEAMRMYQKMQEQGVQPNMYTLISLLKLCGMTSDLEGGRRIHAEALKYRFETDLFVSTSLVDMYAKCGSFVDARRVFDGLSQRDVVSYNAILSAYALQGQSEEVFHLYETMQEEGISPDDRTFVRMLQVCGTLAEKGKDVGQMALVRSLERGKAFHFEAWRRGYESDVFIGNTLVTMYAKCVSIADAQSVFDGLSQRDSVSWTALLSAYAQDGEGTKALDLYAEMQVEGVTPDGWMFVRALQACGTVADVEMVGNGKLTKVKSLHLGKTIHAEAWSRGYRSDVFICNTLVSMYGKCGSIVDAQRVFDGLSLRNVVSWNAMIAAYIQQGQAEKALEVYGQMSEEGVSSDALTCVSALQACAMLVEKGDGTKLLIKASCLSKGKAVHAEACIRGRGYETHVLTGSALVSMYGKCGSLVDAHHVFEKLPQRNVVSWNAMLAAYVQQGKAEEALELYNLILEERVTVDNWTFVSALQACALLAQEAEDVDVDGLLTKVKCLEIGKSLHAEVWGKDHASDVFVGSALISMYAKCGSVSDAGMVFDVLPHPNVVSWNAMLAMYLQQDQAEKALELYSQMLHEGVSVDALSFVSTLQACGMLADKEDDVVVDGLHLRVKSLEQGRALHYAAWKKGYETDAFILNTLISTYGKCGSIADAQILFHGLSKRDVVSWNAMLTAYAQQGQARIAFDLYTEMQNDGVTPDDITYVSILRACSNTGILSFCSQIHEDLVFSGKELSRLLANTLIHAYASSASLVNAENVFASLHQPDVVSWTALIAGYARQGHWETSLQYYDKMQLAGVKPNGVTLLSVLAACSHGGLVARGVEYFESMTRDHGIVPSAEHYVCMVDLLGRAGYFSRIEDVLSTIPMRPTLSMWLCLLGACRKHGKLVLAKQAFEQAVRLQPKHSAPYVLMSNMYAHAQLWDCAKEVDELRLRAGVSKTPGQSWISIDLVVVTFVVGEGMKQEGPLLDLVRKVSLELSKK